MNAFGITSASQLKIEPGTEKWYSYDVDSYIADTIEKAYEWDHEADPHGCCHDRSTLVALVAEIERLRALAGEAPIQS